MKKLRVWERMRFVYRFKSSFLKTLINYIEEKRKSREIWQGLKLQIIKKVSKGMDWHCSHLTGFKEATSSFYDKKAETVKPKSKPSDLSALGDSLWRNQPVSSKYTLAMKGREGLGNCQPALREHDTGQGTGLPDWKSLSLEQTLPGELTQPQCFGNTKVGMCWWWFMSPTWRLVSRRGKPRFVLRIRDECIRLQLTVKWSGKSLFSLQ